MEIFILTALLVFLLPAPLIVAKLYDKAHKSEILSINQNKTRDARYFAKSFASLVRNNLETIEGDRIMLSRTEEFLDGAAAEAFGPVVKKLILVLEGGFSPSRNLVKFEKEIYAEGDISLVHSGTILRSAYSGKRMLLGNEIHVVRWVDAEETLAVYDRCDLGISATAGQHVVIGADCRFQRLYAPELRMGQRPDSQRVAEDGKNPDIYRMPVRRERKECSYAGTDSGQTDGIECFSIFSKDNLTVLERVIIQGDVRSHKGVRLCSGAVVCGNVFAEGDILLEKDAVVLGHVFSQGSIHFEEGAVAGRRGRISSVIARNHITFDKNNFVFGYVSCERGGRTKPEDGKMPVEFTFLNRPAFTGHVSYSDADEFRYAGIWNYCREKELESVTIPEGVEDIYESAFFGCSRLREVRLPKKTGNIGNYAFADCSLLEQVWGLEKIEGREIGISAFENCRTLTKIQLSPTVEKLGGAAFGGCESLDEVVIPKDSRLSWLGDHCFRGCGSLRELSLPDSTEHIGVSAFKDCMSLRRISLPECCRGEPGIEEILHTGIWLDFRKKEGEIR